MDRKELLHLATLSGLSLAEAELPKLEADLARIVRYMGELAEVDTSTVAPLQSPAEGPTPTRPDTVGHELTTEEALAGAPDAVRLEQGGAFSVPGILP
jgi:aspartyl-tRNA(Asn)/glutamyl-tRNA(Gln) amidotransferase subunit C